MDREKVIKGLKWVYHCISPVSHTCGDCPYQDNHVECKRRAISDAITMLKEQEVRELTMNEWQEWKNNPKRNPICELWEHDTSPMWVLNPNDVHERRMQWRFG